MNIATELDTLAMMTLGQPGHFLYLSSPVLLRLPLAITIASAKSQLES